MVKMKIGQKLFLSYLSLVVICFAICALSFHLIFQRVAYRETRSGLRAEGAELSELLSRAGDADASLVQNIAALRQIRIAGQVIDSYAVVVHRQKGVVYTNVPAGSRRETIEAIIRGAGQSRSFIIETWPLTSPQGENWGTLYLAARTMDVNAADRLMSRQLLISGILAGLAALLLAALLARHFTHPIDLLRQTMQGFSLHSPYKPPGIRTGDEIEDLEKCFSEMVQQIQLVDERQKAFLQNASHELKSPLMSIQGYAEAVRDGYVEGSDVDRSLDIIIQESQRLKRIVEEIIVLTRIESPDYVYRFQTESLGDIVNHAIDGVRPLAADRNIAIASAVDAGLRGNLDHNRLVQALVNILSNCIRYAGHTVDVRAGLSENVILIEIKDDGPGFKDEETPYLFERFYKGEHGETGLGLAISKAIIAGHGGSITAKNRPTGGAVFIIRLPA